MYKPCCDQEQYRIADLSSILNNNSHNVMSATLVVTSVMLKFKLPGKTVNVSLNEIKLFSSHNHLTADIWNSSYKKP